MEKDMSLKGSLNSTDKVSDSASTSSFSGEQAARLEKYVWWKLDLSVVFTIFYLLSWLDRTNLGNARVAGLQRDLHLTNDQYSIALTVTFIPYIFAELPSNLLLKVVGPNILLSTLLVLWGVVTTLQGVVHNYAGLLACRFFLGLFEGGVLPGIVLYLSLFYPRAQLQKRLSVVFAASSLAGAFSGLLAAGISEMSGIGGRPGWAWIFILEGIFTVLFGIFSSFFIPSSPMNCRLLKQEEKEYIMLRLREDGAISKDDRNDVFSWREVFKIFYLPHVWLLFFVFFFHGTILYSLSYFAPSIIQGLGYSANRAQLMSVPPYAAAFVLTNVASYVADRYHCRGAVVMFCSACTIVGFSMFLGSHKHAVQYGSLFLTLSGINTAAPTITSWTANNTAPHIRRASAIAVVCMLTNMGGILSTWLLGSLSSAPRYTKATIVLLVFSIGLGVAAGINVLYLWTQNKKKAEIRATITKEEEPVGLGDRSAWFIYIL
ncbi:MFS transporter superfamily protein [Pleurotus pulmonarius]